MPKGYWIAQIDVTDPAAYDGYRKLTPDIIAAHGGRFIVRGGAQEAVEGAARPRTVVVEFPSYEAARACYFSPGYQAAAAIRQGAAASNFLLIEGWEG
jgi:uncharacterized protein (DUF1330 family)